MRKTAVRGRTDARGFLGRIVLFFLVAWAVVGWAVSFSYLWLPRGTVGITANYSGVITGVDPGSAASDAGIAPGDVIRIGATPFESRPKLIGVTSVFPPGERVPLRLASTGADREVTLVARPQSRIASDVLSLLVQLLSSATFIVVGTILILFSPSRVTWGFGLYCLLANPVVPALSRYPSAEAHVVYVTLYDVLQNVGLVGLLVFALDFPRPMQRPWHRTLVRLLPLLFVVLASWTVWVDLSVCLLGRGSHVANTWLQVAFGLVDLVAIAVISETYLKGPEEDRPRLRWVLVGFYLGLVCNFVGNVLLYTGNVTLPFWLDSLLIAAIVSLPLTVGYAVVRHRVIEVDFFVGRAIVYAIFTTALLVVFALIDWLIARVLADFRLSLLLDALASIGAAFAIDAAHGRLERFVDGVLFRSRRIARERLERLAHALRFVHARDALETQVTEEVRDALGLASIALFHREGERYRRVAAVGWGDETRTTLGRDDRLVLEHRATPGPLGLADLDWSEAGFPGGLAAPVLSVPLVSPRELTGFLLCSGTKHGEQLDPEETRWVEEVANAAAVAYEEIETERLRRTAERLHKEVEVLNARLDEARRAARPAPS